MKHDIIKIMPINLKNIEYLSGTICTKEDIIREACDVVRIEIEHGVELYLKEEDNK